MTKTLVAPAFLQLGDRVLVNNQAWFLNSKSEPDLHGVIDYYLVNESGALHYVSAEPITLLV